uniref:Uncharacterized protein n=1 Tax=Trichobilharzia regenti TaxID=157069 RepID=A0AA85K2R0_TRIRE|nr:unnamed protein product [Trichobilharzia regenti]
MQVISLLGYERLHQHLTKRRFKQGTADIQQWLLPTEDQMAGQKELAAQNSENKPIKDPLLSKYAEGNGDGLDKTLRKPQNNIACQVIVLVESESETKSEVLIRG